MVDLVPQAFGSQTQASTTELHEPTALAAGLLGINVRYLDASLTHRARSAFREPSVPQHPKPTTPMTAANKNSAFSAALREARAPTAICASAISANTVAF